MSEPIIDDDGSFDAVDDWSAEDVESVHIERMDTGHVWMGIYLKNNRRYVVNLFTPRNGRLSWRVEEDW